jgi:hypothetical protein
MEGGWGVCVNKFSVNPSSPYSYSEMGSKIFYRCFEVDDVGVSPQANPSRPPRGGKASYTLPPARALRREGRPVRPWREAHSLSPCPDGQRQRLRTRKPDPIARVLHPRSDNTRCCPADSSRACPPGSRRIDVYPHKVPARPEAKSALQEWSRCVPLKGGKDPRQRVGGSPQARCPSTA